MRGINMSEHNNSTGRIGRAATALLVLVIIGLASLFSDFSRTPSGLCHTCHTMAPYSSTWQVSSHSNISCLSCHKSPGFSGSLQLGRNMARYIYRQATKSYILPIRIFGGISDEVCLQCHTFNRQVTLTGDLLIPHEDHSTKNVRCIACHKGVAHGNIGKRRVTISLPAQSWTRDESARQMSRPFTAPPKEDCMSCHFNRRIETGCQSCHSEDKVPASHREPGFLTAHGPQAQEFSACLRCHAYDSKGKKIDLPFGGSLKAYSRRNDFCLDCHRLMPESHLPDFRKHGKAAANNTERCLICHDNQAQADLPEASSLYCGSCHPSPHKKGWQTRHTRRRRAVVTPGMELQQNCFACHDANRCLSCHPPPKTEGEETNMIEGVSDDHEQFKRYGGN